MDGRLVVRGMAACFLKGETDVSGRAVSQRKSMQNNVLRVSHGLDSNRGGTIRCWVSDTSPEHAFSETDSK